jgi:hypothetical protein
MICPDIDNMYTGNTASLTGLTDQKRYAAAIHWFGAGASQITGSDLTHLDTVGKSSFMIPRLSPLLNSLPPPHAAKETIWHSPDGISGFEKNPKFGSLAQTRTMKML